jgi:dsDNA-binding SOS-regulon protein
MSELFLTSMFRSGSTTLARALNAHKQIAFASDPYLEIFKCLRSEVGKDLGLNIPFMRPLGDYYFSPQQENLLQEIEQADPQRSFNSDVWEELMPVLEKRCNTYSENLVPFLENIAGNTYQQVFQSAISQIKECYGTEKTKVTGFKEVWGIDFVPFFLNMFPEGKTIILQRDPRAVCASKNKTSEKYPWVFLCRQWRKIAALAWYYSQHSDYKDRVLVLKFEEFLSRPDQETKKICDFLNIKWDSNIANPETYKGGSGEVWKQNSSYGGGETKFDLAATQRWRTSLSAEEIAYIEYMCGPEMHLHSYEKIAKQPDSKDYWLTNSPRIKDEDQARWMKNIISNSAEDLSSIMKVEQNRYNLLEGRIPAEDHLVKQSFLKQEIYEEILAR